ncbi:thiol:disulfide interchange protein DsbA/DsbL [Candidatus Colwellia aromaticivorans]|uniref:thiol:disulfide interchange protein DsbA/DsbL n=1 Tax=Candidatus Colwellia aromaticivorans TaxID=2267621 RepID=UPI001FE78D74|nr:thiol:disulfide interchange protein DsbA/DsbL [Candidatus Colwellia aromaticivorans]
MKKMQQLLMVLLIPFFALSISACAEKYTEGKQYTKVNETVSAKVEVREYFSFYCPHCLRFEPFMETVKKGLPEGVKFERNHVDFLRAASPKIQAMLTKSVVVAEQLGLDDKLVGAIFNYIQIQKAVITSEKDIRNIFVLNGVDGDKFDKLMKSFSVNSKAKSMKKNQDIMAKKGALKGVPTIIINGKYRINTQALDKNNFEQDYQNLITHLLTLK